MSELNQQPFEVNFEGDLWGDDKEDVFGSSENKELMRGLLVSPEKAGAKGKKFVRGGLAERAQSVVNRSRTAYTLWQKDIEVQLRSIPSARPSKSSLAIYRRTLRPDLLLRVESVLHETRISGVSRGAGALRSVLTRCAAHHTTRDALSTTPSADGLATSLVLFSFSPEIHGGIAVSSSDPTFNMSEGAEILAWKPFHEAVSSGDDGGKDEKALFCSRFLAISRTDSE